MLPVRITSFSHGVMHLLLCLGDIFGVGFGGPSTLYSGVAIKGFQTDDGICYTGWPMLEK